MNIPARAGEARRRLREPQASERWLESEHVPSHCKQGFPHEEPRAAAEHGYEKQSVRANRLFQGLSPVTSVGGSPLHGGADRNLVWIAALAIIGGSPPAWGRGSKLQRDARSIGSSRSPPAWGRGSKLRVTLGRRFAELVAPCMGARIETGSVWGVGGQKMVAPCMGARIETVDLQADAACRGRPLHGGADRNWPSGAPVLM